MKLTQEELKRIGDKHKMRNPYKIKIKYGKVLKEEFTTLRASLNNPLNSNRSGVR